MIPSADLDAILLVLLMICLTQTNKLATGITPLTSRFEVEANIAQVFVPISSKTNEGLGKVFLGMCERLRNPPISLDLVLNIYLAAKGQMSAWVNLGVQLISFSNECEATQE